MSTKKRPPVNDPAEAANKRILEGIREREAQREAERTLAYDIGLDVKPTPKEAENAFEFLAEEFDRKNFGDRPRTFTRIVFGPHPLLSSCPGLRVQLEKHGRERYAAATAEAIMLKGDQAASDAVMQRGLRAAIARFGAEDVAKAFAKKIMEIPERSVEVEEESEDPLLLGEPMREAVERYGQPGMAVKFLSERCIGRFGLRGYEIVKNEGGDPVKVGTLIMGQIPEWKAERRRRFYANESIKQVEEIQDAWNDSAQRAIGGRAGVSVLRDGENINSDAAGDFADDPDLAASYLGRSRATGFRLERQV